MLAEEYSSNNIFSDSVPNGNKLISEDEDWERGRGVVGEGRGGGLAGDDHPPPPTPTPQKNKTVTECKRTNKPLTKRAGVK